MFFVDAQRQAGHLRLLASDRSTADKLNAGMTEAKSALPLLKPVDEGAWGVSVEFADDERTKERIFIVMGLFGFGIYL
jgi:hypothetical protein